jgi:hypothetical protein
MHFMASSHLRCPEPPVGPVSLRPAEALRNVRVRAPTSMEADNYKKLCGSISTSQHADRLVARCGEREAARKSLGAGPRPGRDHQAGEPAEGG